MTNHKIVGMMIEDLKKTGSPGHNTKGAPTFTANMDWIGVRAPQQKIIAKNWISILSDFSSDQRIKLSIELCNREIFECLILAYELLWKNKSVLKALNKEQIIKLGGVLDNWLQQAPIAP